MSGTPRSGEDVAAWVERTCREQGVPVKVADPMVLRQVALLLSVPGRPDDDR